MSNRRNFLKQAGSFTAGSIIAGTAGVNTLATSCTAVKSGAIEVNPDTLFEISDLLYMQFMEPLGSTEPSVEGSWDYDIQDWREDFVDCVKDLAPSMIRWGGILNRYYKWREGIGPANNRPWMYNYHWEGKETNRVGTHEIIDFCKRVGAKPILGVNFESDGFQHYKNTHHGENRFGTIDEAADWVSYCNDPTHKERAKNGSKEAFAVEHWQLGNESSYGGEDGFNQENYISTMRAFAAKMRERDSSVKLIGWGDAPDCSKIHPGESLDGNMPWASPVLQAGSEYLDYIAFHMMGIYPRWKDTVLRGFEYINDPAKAWDELLEMGGIAEHRVGIFRDELKKANSQAGLAITEGHLSLSPYNTNTILRSWLSVAYHAKVLNSYLRNADVVKISTASDFNGARWTVNSVMMPEPRGNSFLLPVGHLMKWFNKEKGSHVIKLTHSPDDLDIAASRDKNHIFLHVLNTSFTDSVSSSINIPGYNISEGIVLEMAPENRMLHIDQTNPKALEPIEKKWTENWTFPPASVSIVKLKIQDNI